MIISLINSVGQRKISKYLFFFSILLNTFCLIIQFSIYSPLTISFWTSIFLMSSPVGFLSLASHKTREYRFFCIVIQAIIIFLNFVLFGFGVSSELFVLTIVELISSVFFYIYIVKTKPKSLQSKIPKIKKEKTNE